MLKKMGLSGPRWWTSLRRDTRVFMYLFPWLTTFVLLLALGITTYLFGQAYLRWEGQFIPFHRAFLAVINLTFFQVNYSELPHNPRMDIFTVLAPLIGLPLFSIFGLRIIRILRVFFLRGERDQEWQEALIAATVQNHILVCGLGRIGYRVARKLAFDYSQPVVGINDVESPLTDILLRQGMPVLLGDVVSDEVLKKGGVDRAGVVIICTNYDRINLETLVRARQLNPKARFVLRMFEDELAADIKKLFELEAVVSRSAAAALSFAYAAIGGVVIETFALEHKTYVLAQFSLEMNSPLLGQTVGQVGADRDLTVVCHYRGATVTVEPPPHTHLQQGDTLFVFTTISEMIKLLNNPVGVQTKEKILVCGLGHTGYRVIINLQQFDCEVVGLDFEANRLTARLQAEGVPIILGDIRWPRRLNEAGIQSTNALVACTDDDMLNLQIALQARRLNPNIRVVMRIFDDTLSRQLRKRFGRHAAYSTSALAAPDFISAALNRINVREVEVDEMEIPQLMVRLEVRSWQLADVPVDELNQEQDLTVLLHAHNSQVDVPPRPQARLQPGDEIVVLVSEAKLADLNRRNQTALRLGIKPFTPV